jgi:pyruvate formate lyase activating enzyme
MTVAQVIRRVEEDAAFYSRSGGGLTLSGGEPMDQPDFATAILKEARRRRIHTAMETCGHCAAEELENGCRHLHTLLFDIKMMNPEKHKQYTGVSNERILENLVRIRAAFPELPILVRTPVIPGVNDREEDIRRILQFIQDMPNVRYEMLPFHRMGKPKYEYLGTTFPMGDEPPDEKIFSRLCNIVTREFGHLVAGSGWA